MKVQNASQNAPHFLHLLHRSGL